MPNISCGIDFGTTNSTVSIVKPNQIPELVPLEGNNVTMPTAIFFEFDDKTWKTSYGTDAVTDYINDKKGRFVRSMKRALGSSLMKTGTVINEKPVKFEYVLRKYLTNLKAKADTFAGQEIENVVMGRPVHFRDDDPNGDAKAQDELKEIAQAIGYKNIEFQYEPIAAAFAHEANIKGEKLACVVDIGGGTSDFSIIRVGNHLSSKSNRIDDILANTGVRIGGNDFDKDLSLESFMPEFGMRTTYGGKSKYDQELNVPTSQFFDLSEWSSVNSLYNYKTINLVKKILFQSNSPEKYGRLLEIIENVQGHTLLAAVEATKIKLTDQEQAKITLNFLKSHPIISTNRKVFEKAIGRDMEKVSSSVEECIKQAQIKESDIQLVILTGGSTEIPYVQDRLCSHFPNAVISGENKFSSVGLGLAYDASRKFGGGNIGNMNAFLNKHSR